MARALETGMTSTAKALLGTERELTGRNGIGLEERKRE